MQTLLEARLPLYREVATLRIDTNRRSASKVATRIVAYLHGQDPDTVAEGEEGR
jgi:shikimate kinase